MPLMSKPKDTNEEKSSSVKKTIYVSDNDMIRYEPSVTWSIFVCWILPVFIIATLTRFAVDKEAGFQSPVSKTRPISIDLTKTAAAPSQQPQTHGGVGSYPTLPTAKRSKKKDAPPPTLIADKPTNYIEIYQTIKRRRLDWEKTDTDPMDEYAQKTSNDSPAYEVSSSRNEEGEESSAAKEKPQLNEPPRGASSDPVRTKSRERINQLRSEYAEDPTNLFKVMELADALRMYDVQYHDGGSAQEEAIERYHQAIALAQQTKQEKVNRGEETNRNLHGTINVPEELMLDYSARSIDGILCALYTALGKVFFMANMFEKAAESYSLALQIEPLYLDAMSARGSSRIILGDYEGAAQDFWKVIDHDVEYRFLDVFTGLARVLQARESAVPQGWEPMIDRLQGLIAGLELQYANLQHHRQGRNIISNSLNRLYHVLFLYHDVKTKDTDAAWENLTKSYKHKMETIPAWNSGMENHKISATKQIFRNGFWPVGVGSQSKVPIFIIGFVRSGSTLLERVLDAHPKIVGTGENSVFNGRLDEIRNKIVETSIQGDAAELTNVISSLADGVVDEMRQRWNMVASGEDRAADEKNPERYVDKMLTNYYNVGFIHMLFPNALILHVAREPMDTVFSAYKHEFPPGTLDYTSDFPSLAELYHGYRDLIDHWDRELPGRITHIRYEDLVHDMPGISKKIIEATGLEWDDSVLHFHKKKQAVNTLSTTQVRKGIYKDSLEAWRRYETHLAPLVKLIGERTRFDLKTSLPGYQPPSLESSDGSEEVSTVEADRDEL